MFFDNKKVKEAADRQPAVFEADMRELSIKGFEIKGDRVTFTFRYRQYVQYGPIDEYDQTVTISKDQLSNIIGDMTVDGMREKGSANEQ